MSNGNHGDKGRQAWWMPSSFKELFGGGLSVVLLILLCIVVAKTFGMMNVLPQSMTVGNTTQVVDTYARSKDLLVILFPFFGAVVTFWLGVAVESKRADQNQQVADRAHRNLQQAASKLGEARQVVASQLKDIQDRATKGAVAPTDAEMEGHLKGIGARLDEAQQQISR